MKWVKRGLWLAAWGCWVWVGWGLYRELPRDLGRPLFQLNLARNESLLGFAPGKEVLVSVLVRGSEDRIFRFRDARTGALRDGETRVLDHDRTLRSIDQLVEPRSGSTKWGPGVVSTDGRSSLVLHSQTLMETETGRVVFEGDTKRRFVGPDGPIELSVSTDVLPVGGRRLFGVCEYWRFRVGSWTTIPQTLAMRSMTDATLCYRMREIPFICAANGTQCIDGNRTGVYALPPHVNYPLLALCQAILALPLALLWAALRWRRKRRMRLASTAP